MMRRIDVLRRAAVSFSARWRSSESVMVSRDMNPGGDSAPKHHTAAGRRRQRSRSTPPRREFAVRAPLSRTRRGSAMPPLELNEATGKRLFKEALVETLYERRSLLREVVAGVLEDAGLTEAIRWGRRTKAMTRDAALRGPQGPRLRASLRGGLRWDREDRSVRGPGMTRARSSSLPIRRAATDERACTSAGAAGAARHRRCCRCGPRRRTRRRCRPGRGGRPTGRE